MGHGGRVSDRTSILWCALAGTIIGGAAGYLFFTDEGRRLRQDLEPRLMDLLAEVEKARAMVQDLDAPRQARADVRPFVR